LNIITIFFVNNIFYTTQQKNKTKRSEKL